MGYLLQVHIVESEHDLVDDIGSLGLREAVDLDESLEKLAAFDYLRDYVVVLLVFQQVDYSDDVWMRFLAKDRELVLKELDVNLLLLDSLLLHDLDRKRLLAVLVHAEAHCSERSLAQSLAEEIPLIDVLDSLE